MRALACAIPLVLTAFVKESAPTVGLNHLMLVPDSATFAAIAASPFLRDTFALFDEWPEERVGRASAPGVAFFGRTTYVAFMRPGSGDAGAWRSRLALGTDQRGALQAIASGLTSEVGPLLLDSVSRQRDSADVPWFYQLVARAAHSDSALAVGVMEYHPNFVRRWYGASQSAVGSIARADVLAHHAARVEGTSVRSRYSFVDIVGIKVAVRPETETLLLGYCRGVGWRVKATSGGTACVGPGVRLFLVPARSGERGIVAFTMRFSPMSKLRGGTTRTFGRSTLRLSSNGFATWEFGQQLTLRPD